MILINCFYTYKGSKDRVSSSLHKELFFHGFAQVSTKEVFINKGSFFSNPNKVRA